MLTKNYQLNIEKSDGTTENISIEIPLKAGTYDVKYTLGTGNAISAGTIVVSDTENTYNLNITLSNDEVKTVQIKTPVALTFANATWEQIAQFSEEGKASEYFSVGDEKTIQLLTGEYVTFVILGFNHDDLSDGSGKAGMSIGMKNLLATTYPMKNSVGTNAGGWDKCAMLNSTLNTIFNQFPPSCKNIIKTVNKKATYGSGSATIMTTASKLWLLAAVEIDGRTTAGYVGEGEQYEYWKTVKDGTVNADRIKYLDNGNGSANNWWLRSAVVGSNYGFHCVISSGAISENNVHINQGVSFGFCV